MTAASATLPKIRDELQLIPGPPTRFGAPTYTLYDPAGQRFFRLGWLETEILSRWSLGDPQRISQAIQAETTLAAPPDTVTLIANFLIANNLTAAATPAETEYLLKQKKARRKSFLSTLMHNYLFLRIPLWHPDGFLSATAGLVGWMFTKSFAVFVLFFAALGLYLVTREWSLFRDSMSSLFTLQGGILAALALGLSKTVHELGHAYAAKLYGLRVPSMGIALMCFAPVLWTDTTEAWKLRDRRSRLAIGAAGVLTELMLATAASLAWPLLPPGPLKTAVFMLAGSIWILTLMVNINPCMRYDGYYLLSDYWDIPTLQPRSFALAKWFLREQLFGLGLPPPEPFPRFDRMKLVAYAFVTWLYRFFLFLGIAFLVYHIFFKALGIILMLVELTFFIALPILKELAHWFTIRDKMRLNFRFLLTTAAFAGLVYFLAVPWHDKIGGAAILTPERRAAFYSPQGGIVEDVSVHNDDLVEPGQSLFRLRSPDLESRIEIAKRKVAAQRLKLSLASLDQGLRIEAAADWDQLERLAEDLAGLLREREELEIKAPFSGRIVDMPEWLTPGGWIQAKEPLSALAGGRHLVQVYVPEYDLDRLAVGSVGRFYPREKGQEPVHLRIETIENQATREIQPPELASLYGGPLGAVKNAASGRLETEHAVYRVTCGVVGEGASAQLLVGHAALDGAPRSVLTEVWRKFMTILVRESGW